MAAVRTPLGRRVVGLGLTVLLTLGTVTVALSAPAPAQAWFDQPLPVSQLPFGPVQITAHATAPGGVDEVQLSVDGVVVASQPIPDKARLATVQFNWLPILEKGYWLTVRGRSGQEWGGHAAIFVIVGNPVAPGASQTPSPTQVDTTRPPTGSPTVPPTATPSPQPTRTAGPTPSPTSTPTRTPKPTPTATPRSTPTPSPRSTPTPPPPCTPPPPSLVSPNDYYFIDDPDLNPPTLMWEYLESPSCQPSGLKVQITWDAGVVTGNLASDTWQWTPPDPFDDCYVYEWRVRAKRSDGTFGPWSEPWHFYVQTVRSCD